MMASTLVTFQTAPVARRSACARRVAVIAEAEAADRRSALLGLASVAALVSAKPASAAYGEAANIFASTPTSTSGFVSYAGDGFALLIPSKWNPSAEKPFAGSVLRYTDFYPVDNLTVFKVAANKGSVDEYGGPDVLLRELQNYGVFGKQAVTGSSKSEGGFAEGRYAAASLLDQAVVTDKKGKKYYQYEVLTRTADGTEGGRTNFIKAAVGSDRNLYVLITSMGDKRMAYAKKATTGARDSFIVA